MRGSGATSRQMMEAPKGALFIWADRLSLNYANALAHHLGRDDLTITAPHVLDDGARRLMGRRFPAIIVDHAAELTDRQYEALAKLRVTCRPAETFTAGSTQ